MRLLTDIVNYLYVGAVPNCIAAVCVEPAIENIIKGDWKNFSVALLAVSYNVAMGFIKYKQYKRARIALEERGWDETLVKPMKYSPCHMHAMRLASKHAGYVLEYKQFMEREGYNWLGVSSKIKL